MPTQKRYSQINERLRQKDKEDLIEEVNGLRLQNNIQGEEIRLLKTEVFKLKKKLA